VKSFCFFEGPEEHSLAKAQSRKEVKLESETDPRLQE